MMPACPGERFFEMLVDCGSDRRPLGVAKHVNEIQISCDHWFKVTSENHLFDNPTSVGECFDSSRETDTPLVHTDALLAEFQTVSVNQVFGKCKNSPILIGLGFPDVLFCQHRRVRVIHLTSAGRAPVSTAL